MPSTADSVPFFVLDGVHSDHLNASIDPLVLSKVLSKALSNPDELQPVSFHLHSSNMHRVEPFPFLQLNDDHRYDRRRDDGDAL